MKIRKSLMAVSAASALTAGLVTTTPAYALTGLLFSLLPPIPDAPALPPLLENLPGIGVPDGAIPNFVLQLPLPIPVIPLPALPLPPNSESNTIANCGASADLTQRMVITSRNLQPNNQVAVYSRNADGSLCQAGVYNTGGASDLCGIVCSSQNTTIVDNGYVFVTNPGSADGPLGNGTVSVFRIEKDQLTLTDVENAGGPNPRSVAVNGDLVYVVNGGFYQGLLGPAISVIPASVQGFRFNSAGGNLTAIPGAFAHTLDAAGDAGDIAIMADKAHMVISNRRTTNAFTSGAEPDNMEVYSLNASGVPVRAQLYDVGGDTPFGFRAVGDKVYLTMGGPTQSPNLGSSGVFQVTAAGGMNTVTPATRDQGTDTCWNAISKFTDVPYLYTSAFFDSQMSQFAIQPDGSMVLVNPRAASSSASNTVNYVIAEGGIDIQVAQNSVAGAEFMYVHNNNIPPPIGLPSAGIAGFRIASNGTLEKLGTWVANGLPNTGYGMWAL